MVMVTCVNPECGKSFNAKPAKIKLGKSKYCSRSCADIMRYQYNAGKAYTDVRNFFHLYPLAKNSECAAVLKLTIFHVNKIRIHIRANEIERYRKEWKAK